MFKKVISLFLLIAFTVVGANAAQIDRVEGAVSWNDGASQASLSLWKNYIFASTDKGLKIYDVCRGDKLSASWVFSSANIPGTMASYVPMQTIVTDEYIIIAFSNQVAVFRNDGEYTNEPPVLLRRIDGLAGTPRMFVKGGYIFFFDLPVRTTQGKKIANGWKVQLSEINNFPMDANKVCRLADAGMLNIYSKKVEIGNLGSLWSFVRFDDNYAYCVAFKTTGKVLSLVRIALDSFDEAGKSEFILDQNSETYSAGTLAVDNGYIYILTNVSQNNKLYIVDKSAFSLIAAKELPASVYNGFQDVTIVGNVLFGLMSNVNDKAGVIDISNPNDVITNMAEYDGISSGISIVNSFSNIIALGNRLYYALNTNGGIGIIKTNTEMFNLSVSENNTAFPVLISGVCTNSDTVKLAIGDFIVTVPVNRSIWSYPIYKCSSGNILISASANGATESKQINININKPPVEMGNIKCDSGKISADIINNTNLFDKMLKSNAVCVIAAVYGSDNKMLASSEKLITAAFGEQSSFELTTGSVPNGGYIKIFTLSSSDLMPFGQTYSVSQTGEVTASNENEIIYGSCDGSISVSPQVETINGKVYIKGNVPNGANRRVSLKVSYQQEGITIIKEYNQTVTDNNGDFTFEYLYSGDTVASGTTYQIKVGSARYASANAEFQAEDVAAVNERLQYIKTNIKDGGALKTYFETNENKQLALAIGVNCENPYYERLNELNKIVVMGKVLEKICTGNVTEIKDTFVNTSVDLANEQDISDINNAAVSTLTGILTKLYERGQISEATYIGYTNLGSKMAEANDIFIKGGAIKALDEVEPRLENATKEANKPAPAPSSGHSTGSGRKSGGVITTPPMPAVTIPDNKNELKEKFTDLESVPWAKESIISLENNGFINGVSNDKFAPNDFVTREQFVKMLVLSLGLSVDGAACSFEDVTEDEWYYKYVAAAENLGLTKGNGNLFGAGKNLTREEMSVFAFRAAQIASLEMVKKNDSITFNDGADISEYAKDAVLNMQQSGIINGTGDNMFQPKQTCTRAMAAKVIYELSHLQKTGGF